MSIRRHTAYNVAGAIVPLVATLVTFPIYLQAIGEERYGILIILWSLLGYFGLFDLGLGRAVTNRIAAFKERTAREREEVFWTALVMNLALGCAGSLVLWGAGNLLFSQFISAPGALMTEVLDALPWMALAFPLLLVASVMSGALMGREEFLAQNAVAIGTGVLVQVVPLLVALFVGPTLPLLVLAVLGVRILDGIALFGLCMRRLPLGIFPRLARSQVRPLFHFGGWVSVTSIISPLLTTLDRVLIGAIAGVKAVTYYSVPFSLASRISVIPGSLSAALFPRFSSLGASERSALLATAVKSLVVVITPLVVIGMLVMEPFLHWWVDAEFASQAAPVGEILVIGIWANCLAYIPFAMIQGHGRPDLTAKLHLAELLPYVALLWLALEWKGAVGAAMAWSLRVWVDAALMFWASRFCDPKMLLVGCGALSGAGATVAFTSGTEWQGLSIRGVVILTVTVVAWLVAPDNLKNWATPFFRRWRLAKAPSV
jgi:O-antigen/teichoic acid export membrane protein